MGCLRLNILEQDYKNYEQKMFVVKNYLTSNKTENKARRDYLYGYQGSEKDNEVSGSGNSYTTEFRQLDPRLGRWFSVDPIFKPHESPYVSMGNNPINYNDPLGLDETTGKTGSKHKKAKGMPDKNKAKAKELEEMKQEAKKKTAEKKKDASKTSSQSKTKEKKLQEKREQAKEEDATIEAKKEEKATQKAAQDGQCPKCPKPTLVELYDLQEENLKNGYKKEIVTTDGEGNYAWYDENGNVRYDGGDPRWTVLENSLLVVLPSIKPLTLSQAAKGVTAEGAVWAQKTFSGTFSAGGKFAGQTVDDVARMLRSGTLSAADVPINVVVRNGQTFILNTRSSAALMRAGIPRSSWNVVNQTGVSSFESMLTGQLGRNGLINGTNTIRQSGTQLILSH